MSTAVGRASSNESSVSAHDLEDGSHERTDLMEKGKHAGGGSSSSGGAAAEKPTLARPAEAGSNQALPAIVFWIAMSCAVILFNKFLYSGTFKHPLSLTTVHMGFASLATFALRLSGKLQVPSLGWAFYARNVLPIGILFAFSLGTSNLAAMRLSVSFIQMVKALTPMITLAISVAMGMERSTRSLVFIVTLMCVGVGIASYGELEFDSTGVLLQLTSITCEAARLVVTQSLLQAHLPKSNPLVSISLFAPCSFLFLLPVALWNEPGALAKVLTLEVGSVVALNTLTAFTLNIAVVILVSQTSGLTLTLAGIIKDILLIVASIFLFASPITYIQVVGYTLALYGLNMYHLYRACKGLGPGGAPIQLEALAKEAATDKNMAAMGAGMVVLLFVAKSG